MFMRKRLWTALSLLLITAWVLTACVPAPAAPSTGGAATGAQQAAEGPKGTLTVALTTDIAAVELPYAPERQSANASQPLYDSLVFPEADGTYSPALAEKWEVSADGTTYTFHLRQGVTFHNGEPFTADSVVYSWKNYSAKDVPYASNWTIADNVEKVDDATVKISTKEPNALLLSYIGGWSMIPPKAHAEMGKEKFAQNPIGTGPFMFKEWVKGDHLTVVANPNYWRKGYPKLAQINFKIMPESAARVAAVQTNEIDIAPRLTAEEADSLNGKDNLNVVNYPVDRIYYVAFNNMTTGKDTPIMDVKVRQAIGYAIDVQAMIDSLLGGKAVRASGFVGPNNMGFDKAAPLPYDPDKAKALLKEAGHADGFKIDMACPEAAYPHINEVCQAIQGYLKAVGIDANLELQEANAYWDHESKKQLPPIFVDSWSLTIPEAYPRLLGAVGKDETYANWDDPKLHDYLKQLITTLDIGKRTQIYGEVQKYMREDPSFVYLYFPQTFEGVNKRVENYKPRGAENYYLTEVSVSDGK